MTDLFDPREPAHVMARERLDDDTIVWLVSTDSQGRPYAAPVWFFWEDECIVILSRPSSLRAAHARRGSPAVAHFDTRGPFGSDVVVLRGDLRARETTAAHWMSSHRDAYLAKYAAALAALGATLDDFVEDYSTVIEFVPRRLTAWQD